MIRTEGLEGAKQKGQKRNPKIALMLESRWTSKEKMVVKREAHPVAFSCQVVRYISATSHQSWSGSLHSKSS
jgi:hypothetical protein